MSDYRPSNRAWSAQDISDLRQCETRGITLDGAAVLLNRDLLDVAKKAVELGVTLQPAYRVFSRRT
jgi:hypothetical protein